MIKPSSKTTRRNFLANSAALGTVMGLGAIGASVPQSAFAASRTFAPKPHGCAAKHAEISENLRQIALQPNIDPSAIHRAQKTSHCSDCGTMIGADMQLVA